MDEFAGKVAVVTGAGSGIGRALALRFAAEGMRVALADIDLEALNETVALVEREESGPTVVADRVDVSVAADVARFADAVFAECGHVDLLCNNAGVFVGGYLWDRSVEDIEFVLGVNLWGMLNGIRSFVPRMIAQDTDGHIVNTVSVAGLFGSSFSGPYNISKFAAFAATETLAGDLIMAGSKLRASALCPGIVSTNIATTAQARVARAGNESAVDQKFVTDLLLDLVPKGIDPADVAQVVVDGIRAQRFLILTHANHADFITSRAVDLVARRLPSAVDYT